MSGRAWIRPGADDDGCVLWVELGGGRWLYVMNDGKHGVESDDRRVVPLGVVLSDRADWEEVK